MVAPKRNVELKSFKDNKKKVFRSNQMPFASYGPFDFLPNYFALHLFRVPVNKKSPIYARDGVVVSIWILTVRIIGHLSKVYRLFVELNLVNVRRLCLFRGPNLRRYISSNLT
ncbi:hypothetical protein QE152_g22681 [Popillia japonica]|uniref:Uncharacterized protein n=1 Tax=Popillia japonica TaxID=7064 RepID=A0AAW1KJ87_POPJA